MNGASLIHLVGPEGMARGAHHRCEFPGLLDALEIMDSPVADERRPAQDPGGFGEIGVGGRVRSR